MECVGRSTLLNKVCKLIGFGFKNHVSKKNRVFYFAFYRIEPHEDHFVVCIKEIEDKEQSDLINQKLGDDISGSLIASHAQRGIEGVSYRGFKNFATKSFKDIKFEWWEGKNG